MTANKTWLSPQRPQRLVEARQRQAERYVNGVLLSLDDETLKRHGYSRAELSKRATSEPLLVLTLQVERHPAVARKRADVAESLADIGGEHGVALTFQDP